MQLGIISDTHDRIQRIDQALDMFQEQGIKQIIHCGDWVKPQIIQYFIEQANTRGMHVIGVLGNNDREAREILLAPTPPDFLQTIQPLVLEITIDNKKIAVHHGHEKKLVKQLIESQKYDVIFIGHSHTARNEIIGKTLIVNPGSVAWTFPGRTQKNLSVGTYNTHSNSIEHIAVST